MKKTAEDFPAALIYQNKQSKFNLKSFTPVNTDKCQSVCLKGDNQGGALYGIRRRRNVITPQGVDVIIFVRKCM